MACKAGGQLAGQGCADLIDLGILLAGSRCCSRSHASRERELHPREVLPLSMLPLPPHPAQATSGTCPATARASATATTGTGSATTSATSRARSASVSVSPIRLYSDAGWLACVSQRGSFWGCLALRCWLLSSHGCQAARLACCYRPADPCCLCPPPPPLSFRADKPSHAVSPRYFVHEFGFDWDLCIELNPWVRSAAAPFCVLRHLAHPPAALLPSALPALSSMRLKLHAPPCRSWRSPSSAPMTTASSPATSTTPSARSTSGLRCAGLWDGKGVWARGDAG